MVWRSMMNIEGAPLRVGQKVRVRPAAVTEAAFLEPFLGLIGQVTDVHGTVIDVRFEDPGLLGRVPLAFLRDQLEVVKEPRVVKAQTA
jgi:hypothetical protein